MDEPEAPIVAIDGPSGVGKTTVARGVAERLGLPCFETGAMYRALGLVVLERGVDPGDGAEVERIARRLDLGYRVQASGRVEILLDGAPVGDRIHGPEVSEVTSRVAVHAGVREHMVDLQRRWALERGAVMEGRDIGTRVFPEARHKYFLDAPPAVRAERRFRQLRERGHTEVSRTSVASEVDRRDRRDSGRRFSPLTRDASYTLVDTSEVGAEEIIDRIVRDLSGQPAG